MSSRQGLGLWWAGSLLVLLSVPRRGAAAGYVLSSSGVGPLWRAGSRLGLRSVHRRAGGQIGRLHVVSVSCRLQGLAALGVLLWTDRAFRVGQANRAFWCSACFLRYRPRGCAARIGVRIARKGIHSRETLHPLPPSAASRPSGRSA